MSFLPINRDNDEAPQGVTSTNPAGEAPPETPQSGGSAGAGAEGPKGSATGTSTQFGSSASKLGDYLSANAPQITQQANTLAGNLGTQYGQLNQGITDAANQFQQQVQGGYAQPNQNIVNQAIANPTQFAQTPENVKAFQAQYNNQYTGPQNFESFSPYSNIQGQVGQAVQQGNLLGSQAGLQSYLQGKGKNPTNASSTLDALLLQGNPEAKAKVQGAAQKFNELTGQLETAKTGANQSVQDAQKAAQESATYAKSQFDPYVQQFGQQLTTGAEGAEKQRQAYNQALGKSQTQATDAGQAIRNYLSQVPLSVNDPFAGILAQSPIINPITTSNTATPQDLAIQQALSQLGGQNLNYIDPNNPLNPVNIPGNIPNLTDPLQGWMQNQWNPAAKQYLGNRGWNSNESNALTNLFKNLQPYDPRMEVGPTGTGYNWGK